MKVVQGQFKEVDILAIGVHPDDIELSCSGTLLSHKNMGMTVGVADLTQGELGSRGSASIRINESAAAAHILGLDFRVNLEMRDGFFEIDQRHVLRIAELIRRCRPKTVLANSIDDRHPDHGRAAELVRQAFFYSGLRRIEIGDTQAYRAEALYHYIQDKHLTPDFCVDVSPYVDIKLNAIKSFETQFNVDKSEKIQTPISSKSFIEFIESKMKVFGRSIGVEYAEGYKVHRTIGVDNLNSLI